jgi:hypothetical protein
MSNTGFSDAESLSRSMINGIEHKNLMPSYESYLTSVTRCHVEARSRYTSDRENGLFV